MDETFTVDLDRDTAAEFPEAPSAMPSPASRAPQPPPLPGAPPVNTTRRCTYEIHADRDEHEDLRGFLRDYLDHLTKRHRDTDERYLKRLAYIIEGLDPHDGDDHHEGDDR